MELLKIFVELHNICLLKLYNNKITLENQVIYELWGLFYMYYLLVNFPLKVIFLHQHIISKKESNNNLFLKIFYNEK